MDFSLLAAVPVVEAPIPASFVTSTKTISPWVSSTASSSPSLGWSRSSPPRSNTST